MPSHALAFCCFVAVQIQMFKQDAVPGGDPLFFVFSCLHVKGVHIVANYSESVRLKTGVDVPVSETVHI